MITNKELKTKFKNVEKVSFHGRVMYFRDYENVKKMIDNNKLKPKHILQRQEEDLILFLNIKDPVHGIHFQAWGNERIEEYKGFLFVIAKNNTHMTILKILN